MIFLDTFSLLMYATEFLEKSEVGKQVKSLLNDLSSESQLFQ
jgi:hypothetical protein